VTSIHTKLKAVEILRAAREWLSNPDHWSKGRYGGCDGPNCAAGAVMRAHRSELQADISLKDEAFALLEEDLPCALEDWNDAKERTHTDVLARFDAAIARGETLADEMRSPE
jgi:hypothetical protein